MGVLFCISGIGTGHISRCLPIIESLSAEGHECVAAVTGYRAGKLLDGVCRVVTPPPAYRERVAPVASEMPPFVLIPGLGAVPSAYQRDPVEGLKATIEFFGGVIDEVRPEMVVIDQVLGVEPIARAAGVPVVQVTHAPFVPGFGPWADEELVSDPRIEVAQIDRVLEEAFAGVTDRTPAIEDLVGGDLILIPCHPAFGTCPGAFHYRPDRLPEPGREVSDLDGQPMVLSYLSFRAPDLGVPVVRGILDTGCRAVLVGGEDYRLPGDLASDPRVEVLGRVPIEKLLSEAAAIVHGGGSVMTQEAVAAGIPQVAIPRNTEQGVTSTAMERAGAGIVVPVSPAPMEAVKISTGLTTLAHRSVESLDGRITSALLDLIGNDDVSVVVHDLGDEIRRLPTVADATVEVEALLGTRA